VAVYNREAINTSFLIGVYFSFILKQIGLGTTRAIVPELNIQKVCAFLWFYLSVCKEKRSQFNPIPGCN
jgi:hypothetical protein